MFVRARSHLRSTNNRSPITNNSVRPSEPCAFTLLPARDRSVFRIFRFLTADLCSLTSKKRSRFHGFTLLELLVVIAILSILLVALIPALSISKSSGRKGAVSNLLGVMEQARAEAIKTGQATYVVFPTFASGTSQTTLERYSYKSFAIFEDDPANTGAPKQLTKWQTLPIGVAIRAAGTAPLSSLADPATLSPPVTSFAFTPDSNATPAFYCIKFNASGEIESPASNVTLAIFEGFVNGGSEVITSAKDSSGEPAAKESITIARLTGRAERAQ